MKGSNKMETKRTYHFMTNNRQSISFSGANLKDAIEKNFDTIASHKNIGNVAGYQLDQVYLKREGNDIVLHVIAHGSDSYIGKGGYDPYNDEPKETTIYIDGITEEDRNEIKDVYEFELKESKPFDIFDNDKIKSNEYAYGIAMGIIDEIGKNHSALPRDQITVNLNIKFPTLIRQRPIQFLAKARKYLASTKPKKDAETKKLLARIEELIAVYPVNRINNEGAEQLGYYHTKNYFYTHNKITAMQKYREAKNITINELSEIVGITARQLSSYEKPLSSSLGNAKYVVVENIAKALDVKPSDLVKNGFVILVNRN